MENMLQSFPEKSYDVVNYCEAYGCICCCIITSKMLELQHDEAVLKTTNCCCKVAQRRPYAQLNIIEQREVCCGICAGINSDLAPMNEKGEGGMSPGCGCQTEKVREIVQELNARKDGRGQVAQTRQQRYMLERISKLAVQIPVLLKHYGVEYPPDEPTLARLFANSPPLMNTLQEVAHVEQLPEFGLQEFDVTAWIQTLCCTNRLLSLGPDEATLTTNQWITGSVTTQKVPYANIDSVDSLNQCGCCAALNAGDLTQPPGSQEGGAPISPGCGCSRGLVEAIRADLQKRIDIRGNLGQLKQLEKMMSKYFDFAAEMPLILDKLGADTAYPPSQQTMTQVYGNIGPAVPPATDLPHISPSQNFQTTTFNVRNEIQNICVMLSTCCIAGCTKHEVVLEPEQMVNMYSNNCMNSTDRKPYAQLGAVDEDVNCFCCFSVNDICPGYGCSKALVEEIADELQKRKVGRGNIAQLRNQENTMVKAIEVDIRTDILLNKQNIPFPPSQETMVSLYAPSPPPTLPAANAERGQAIHYEASQLLDTKHYDVTNTCGRVCCCNETIDLELNDEEAVFRKRSWCAKSNRREPYAQLGSVEPAQTCCGVCSSVQTDQNVVCPGCGCSHELLKEVADELQHRKVTRGNIAQIKQQENLMMEIIKLGVKADLLAEKEGIRYPPPQATMDAVFGAGFTVPSIEIQQAPRRPSQTYVQVTIPSGLQPGSVFQYSGSFGSFPVTVPQGALAGQTIEVEVPAAERSNEMSLLSA